MKLEDFNDFESPEPWKTLLLYQMIAIVIQNILNFFGNFIILKKAFVMQLAPPIKMATLL